MDFCLDTQAHLLGLLGEYASAIALQEKAAKFAEDQNRETVTRYLKELQDKKATTDKP